MYVCLYVLKGLAVHVWHITAVSALLIVQLNAFPCLAVAMRVHEKNLVDYIMVLEHLFLELMNFSTTEFSCMAVAACDPAQHEFKRFRDSFFGNLTALLIDTNNKILGNTLIIVRLNTLVMLADC